MTTVEVPELAKGRPFHRGLLVPFSVKWFEGVPDFKVADPEVVVRCVRERLCGLCGRLMGETVVFVGGPLTMQNRLFTDPAMHRECATYSLSVCPFLAGAITVMATTHKNPSHVNDAVDPVRPDRFGTLETRDYQLAKVQGAVYIYAQLGTIRWVR